MPICFVHAYQVHRQIDDLLTDEVSEPERTHVVYYLAISPTTVKIGTTGDIKGRMRGLRTDLQYVLAVEPGDYTVEHQRHKEFSQDRIGRREDFRVSPELEHHIKQLQASDYSTEFLAAQM
ncbi:MAG TPA: GIY-YIG nuclease family protein [Candidatus Saccharimonadales bacterium]|nr:GIY-YIG nuclease family protein [Candidatus Saccharimonadales bacterium]